MNLYIVRHGQSSGNSLKIHQWESDPLTPLGIKQAQAVANRFKKIPIDLIISSDMQRAKHTAEIIGQKISQPVTLSKQIRELSYPSDIKKISQRDPKSLEVVSLIKENLHNPEFHYSDEENFFDLKRRVFDFMKDLEAKQEENILVVAHGFPIRVIIGYILFADKFDSHLFDRFDKHMETVNTGISLAKWENNNWKLRSWNDHAHLS